MSTLEWTPSFGPIGFSVLVLGSGALFYALFQRLASRQGARHAWTVLSPKLMVVVLILLALLDPAWKSARWNSNPAKVIVLQDVSASMDLRDDGSTSRSDRASKIIKAIESAAPDYVKFEVLPFDTGVHEAGYKPKAGAERGTDLASIFVALNEQGNLTGADGVILVTDGGDESVDIAKLPPMPLAIVGVGTPADSWNDIGLGSVNAPASIEEGNEFDIEAEVYARQGTLSRSPDALTALKVSLEEWRDKKWVETQSKTVDLRSLRGAASFHIKASGTGALRYRVRLPSLTGELTQINNQRTVNVQIQKRALHVLYFTQELGADYKYLRAELASDPGIAFTAMYRVQEDKFTVQGDRTGYEDLERGFPTDDAILRRYDCLIFGSFAANLLTDAQTQALVRYVSNGGALILLGGESSFGRGGYAESKLAPLFPWTIARNEPELLSGNFPVTLAASAGSAGFTNGWREALASTGGAALDSINQPGSLRPGAVSLLEASNANRLQSVVALQRYGKGQVLGIATNTLWRWAAAGQNLKVFFGKFWRQSARGLTAKIEGGSLLGIRWDKEHYRPGEQATVEVRMQGASDSGAVRLVGSLSGPTGDSEISLTPVAGQAGFYTAKLPLNKRGDFTFRLAAYAGNQAVENYERLLTVEPLVEEGANPELKEAYLRDIATRAKGVYASETDVAAVKTFLREKMVSQQTPATLPLVDVWNIFLVVVLVLLVLEWTLRRRLNLI
jgi:hypothetical protein